jgi:hypothetical protein
MNVKLVIALSFGCSVLIHLPRAWAEKPPIDVRALDDEDEDFFNDKPAKKKAEEKQVEEKKAEEKKDDARSNEDKMFDELNANENGVKVTKKKKGDNDNTNIVNVYVNGGNNKAEADQKQLQKQSSEQKQEATTPPITPTPPLIPSGQTPPGQKARTTRETVPYGSVGVISRTPPPPPPRQHTWSDWWNRENKLESGDVLFFYQIGGYGGVFNQGLGLEGMFSDWTGLRLSVNGSFFDAHGGDRWGDGADGDLSSHGYGFFNGGSVSTTAEVFSAFTHFEDLALTFHLGHHGSHGFDLFPSIGVAHFGYDLKTDIGDIKGGAGFAKLGLGLNWFYKRFFVGVELGWYPLEIFKYGIGQSQTQPTLAVQPNRNPQQVTFEDVGTAWDAHRTRFTFQLGMNF